MGDSILARQIQCTPLMVSSLTWSTPEIAWWCSYRPSSTSLDGTNTANRRISFSSSFFASSSSWESGRRGIDFQYFFETKSCPMCDWQGWVPINIAAHSFSLTFHSTCSIFEHLMHTSWVTLIDLNDFLTALYFLITFTHSPCCDNLSFIL